EEKILRLPWNGDTKYYVTTVETIGPPPGQYGFPGQQYQAPQGQQAQPQQQTQPQQQSPPVVTPSTDTL
ncbi:MAG: hypothetical protein EOO39_25960, partial [Cytophagaceae bacterium]